LAAGAGVGDCALSGKATLEQMTAQLAIRTARATSNSLDEAVM
jgi:hypothetical protein